MREKSTRRKQIRDRFIDKERKDVTTTLLLEIQRNNERNSRISKQYKESIQINQNILSRTQSLIEKKLIQRQKLERQLRKLVIKEKEISTTLHNRKSKLFSFSDEIYKGKELEHQIREINKYNSQYY